MELGILGDAIRLDIFRHRFVHIALAQLRIRPTGPMSDQFVSQSSANAGENKVPNCMFQDRTVANLQNMLQVHLVATRPRLGERHVTNPAGHLGQILRGHFAVGLPRDAVIRQKPVQFPRIDSLPPYQVHGGVTQYTNILAGIKQSHGVLPAGREESFCRESWIHFHHNNTTPQ